MADMCERVHKAVSLRVRTMALRLVLWKGAKHLAAAVGTSCVRIRHSSDDAGSGANSSRSSESENDNDFRCCGGSKSSTQGVICCNNSGGANPLFFLPDEDRHGRARLVYRHRCGDQASISASVSSLLLISIDTLCASSCSVIEALMANIPPDIIQVQRYFDP